jgi:hypothetical protein
MQPNEGVSRKWTLLCPVLAELRMGVQNIVPRGHRHQYLKCLDAIDAAEFWPRSQPFIRGTLSDIEEPEEKQIGNFRIDDRD